MSDDDFVDVTVHVMKATERAALIADCDGVEHWIPLSQFYDDDIEDHVGRGKVTLPMRRWIAEREGLA